MDNQIYLSIIKDNIELAYRENINHFDLSFDLQYATIYVCEEPVRKYFYHDSHFQKLRKSNNFESRLRCIVRHQRRINREHGYLLTSILFAYLDGRKVLLTIFTHHEDTYKILWHYEENGKFTYHAKYTGQKLTWGEE